MVTLINATYSIHIHAHTHSKLLQKTLNFYQSYFFYILENLTAKNNYNATVIQINIDLAIFIMLSKFRLKIVDHFAYLVNQIDIKAESLLQSASTAAVPEQTAKFEIINEKRANFINEIKKEEEFNLRHLKEIEIVEAEDEEKTNSIIFKSFCLIVDKSDLEFPDLTVIDATFGYLLKFDKYLGKTDEEKFRKLLKFYNKETINSYRYFDLRFNVTLKF